MSGAQESAPAPTWDVIVVGAGLAGLSAAHGLRERRVRVLEREPRAGGRVLTHSRDAFHMDLGACFAFPPEGVPLEGASAERELVPERGPIGISFQGRLVFAASAGECASRLSLPAASWEALRAFREGRRAASELPADAYGVLAALFHQIHPGRVEEYTRERQLDAVRSLFPDHWATGNGDAVSAFLERLPGAVRTGCEVLSLREAPEAVYVRYREQGRMEEASCRAIVLATPATVARALLAPLAPACLGFLSHVRYERYTVVALGLEAPGMAEFRYIAACGSGFSVVLQQGSADRRYRTLLCYYASEEALAVEGLSDEALVRATREDLAALAIPGFRLEHVRHEQVKRWELSGTVLSESYEALKSEAMMRATQRIFLAGDYTCVPGWGYGMGDALRSGMDAAARVRTLLDAPR